MLSVGRWDSAIGHIPLVGGIAEYGGPVHVDQAYANRKMFDQPLERRLLLSKFDKAVCNFELTEP